MVFVVRLTSLQMTEGKQSIIRSSRDGEYKRIGQVFSMKAMNRAGRQSRDILLDDPRKYLLLF